MGNRGWPWAGKWGKQAGGWADFELRIRKVRWGRNQVTKGWNQRGSAAFFWGENADNGGKLKTNN